MYIEFRTVLPGEVLWACSICCSPALDRGEHAAWHRRNEDCGIGDASSTGPAYAVREPSSGYGAALTDRQAVAHGLLADTGPQEVRSLQLMDGSHPFAAPVTGALPLDPEAEQRTE